MAAVGAAPLRAKMVRQVLILAKQTSSLLREFWEVEVTVEVPAMTQVWSSLHQLLWAMTLTLA